MHTLLLFKFVTVSPQALLIVALHLYGGRYSRTNNQKEIKAMKNLNRALTLILAIISLSIFSGAAPRSIIGAYNCNEYALTENGRTSTYTSNVFERHETNLYMKPAPAAVYYNGFYLRCIDIKIG